MNIGIDIGGTLIKIAIKQNNITFKCFRNEEFGIFLEYIKLLILDNNIKIIGITGGGAHKYFDLLKKKLNIEIIKYDEFYALINGINKTYNKLNSYLVTNIGSGVSILKVVNNKYFERIGGTNVGGGTFFNLSKYLTEIESFDKLIDLSKDGDNKNVDMLVKDIYGSKYNNLGGDLVASSFNCINIKEHSKSDIINSMLKMICYNISQLAVLYAQQNNLNKIIFTGFFPSKKEVIEEIKFGVNFWSNNKMECVFLENNGYMGSIGCIN
jgi:pantothenate kinase